MGLPRRFLNLIVDNFTIPGAKSLRCIDMRRHKLFNTAIPALQRLKGNRPQSESPQDATPCADDHKNKIGTSPLPAPSTTNLRAAMGFSTETSVLKSRETPESSASDANDRKNFNRAAASKPRKIPAIQLPQPIMNFGCSMDGCQRYLDCLPLAGHKVLCVDPSARNVLFDVGMCQVETIPCFNVRKRSPLPCWVPLPSSASAAADGDGNGSFYIFESSPYQEELRGGDDAREKLSNQFVAFVYHGESKSWQRQLLPPPPFVHDPKHYEHYRHPDITSYAVVERGSSHVIFLSLDGAGGPGTYCLDTVTHTWSHVGDWVLPFKGKVEYVPELKLWFGICTEGLQLGAADLSTMDSQPQIVGTWKELEAPRGLREMKPPQLVNLGSGRFCITRFFRALLNRMSSVNPMALCDYGYDPVEDFTILTGVDVVPCVHDAHGTASDTLSDGNGGKGKVELQMIKHNSRRHMSHGSDGNIEAVF